MAQPPQPLIVDKQTFQFQNYQIDAIKRITSDIISGKNHGMILVHQMGSGKTLTAIGAFINTPYSDEDNKEIKRVIFTPKGLDQPWKTDSEDYGFSHTNSGIYDLDCKNNEPDTLTPAKINKNTKFWRTYHENKHKIPGPCLVDKEQSVLTTDWLRHGHTNCPGTNGDRHKLAKFSSPKIRDTERHKKPPFTCPLFYSYPNIVSSRDANIFKNMENSIVIFDEAHNIINLVRDMNKSPFESVRLRAKQFLNGLKKARYLILLTGTPIEKELQELRYLVNIVGNREIIPISDYDFTLKYTDVDLNLLETLLWDNNFESYMSSAFIFKLPHRVATTILNIGIWILWDIFIKGIVIGGFKMVHRTWNQIFTEGGRIEIIASIKNGVEWAMSHKKLIGVVVIGGLIIYFSGAGIVAALTSGITQLTTYLGTQINTALTYIASFNMLTFIPEMVKNFAKDHLSTHLITFMRFVLKSKVYTMISAGLFMWMGAAMMYKYTNINTETTLLYKKENIDYYKLIDDIKDYISYYNYNLHNEDIYMCEYGKDDEVIFIKNGAEIRGTIVSKKNDGTYIIDYIEDDSQKTEIVKYDEIKHELTTKMCYYINKQSFSGLEKLPSICYNSPYNCIKDIKNNTPMISDDNKADNYEYWYNDFQSYISVLASFKNLKNDNIKSSLGLISSITENELVDFTGLLSDNEDNMEENIQKVGNLSQDSIFFGINRSRFELGYIDETRNTLTYIKTQLKDSLDSEQDKQKIDTWMPHEWEIEESSILNLNKSCLLKSCIISLYSDLLNLKIKIPEDNMVLSYESANGNYIHEFLQNFNVPENYTITKTNQDNKKIKIIDQDNVTKVCYLHTADREEEPYSVNITKKQIFEIINKIVEKIKSSLNLIDNINDFENKVFESDIFFSKSNIFGNDWKQGEILDEEYIVDSLFEDWKEKGLGLKEAVKSKDNTIFYYTYLDATTTRLENNNDLIGTIKSTKDITHRDAVRRNVGNNTEYYHNKFTSNNSNIKTYILKNYNDYMENYSHIKPYFPVPKTLYLDSLNEKIERYVPNDFPFDKIGLDLEKADIKYYDGIFNKLKNNNKYIGYTEKELKDYLIKTPFDKDELVLHKTQICQALNDFKNSYKNISKYNYLYDKHRNKLDKINLDYVNIIMHFEILNNTSPHTIFQNQFDMMLSEDECKKYFAKEIKQELVNDYDVTFFCNNLNKQTFYKLKDGGPIQLQWKDDVIMDPSKSKSGNLGDLVRTMKDILEKKEISYFKACRNFTIGLYTNINEPFAQDNLEEKLATTSDILKLSLKTGWYQRLGKTSYNKSLLYQYEAKFAAQTIENIFTNRIFETDKFRSVIEGNIDTKSRQKYTDSLLKSSLECNYLPVVYSNFYDIGYRQFSAYSACRRLNCIVLDVADRFDVRDYLQKIGSNVSYPLIETPQIKSGNMTTLYPEGVSSCYSDKNQKFDSFKVKMNKSSIYGENYHDTELTLHTDEYIPERFKDLYNKCSSQYKLPETRFNSSESETNIVYTEQHNKKIQMNRPTLTRFERYFHTSQFIFRKSSYVSNNRPICVLLHPALIEGISFSHAPSMHVLEVPEGFGKTEQIYARVLRYIYDNNVGTTTPTLIKSLITKKADVLEIDDDDDADAFDNLKEALENKEDEVKTASEYPNWSINNPEQKHTILKNLTKKAVWLTDLKKRWIVSELELKSTLDGFNFNELCDKIDIFKQRYNNNYSNIVRKYKEYIFHKKSVGQMESGGYGLFISFNSKLHISVTETKFYNDIADNLVNARSYKGKFDDTKKNDDDVIEVEATYYDTVKDAIYNLLNHNKDYVLYDNRKKDESYRYLSVLKKLENDDRHVMQKHIIQWGRKTTGHTWRNPIATQIKKRSSGLHKLLKLTIWGDIDDAVINLPFEERMRVQEVVGLRWGIPKSGKMVFDGDNSFETISSFIDLKIHTETVLQQIMRSLYSSNIRSRSIYTNSRIQTKSLSEFETELMYGFTAYKSYDTQLRIRNKNNKEKYIQLQKNLELIQDEQISKSFRLSDNSPVDCNLLSGRFGNKEEESPASQYKRYKNEACIDKQVGGVYLISQRERLKKWVTWHNNNFPVSQHIHSNIDNSDEKLLNNIYISLIKFLETLIKTTVKGTTAQYINDLNWDIRRGNKSWYDLILDDSSGDVLKNILTDENQSNEKLYELFVEDESLNGPIVTDSELSLICKTVVANMNNEIMDFEGIFYTMIRPEIPVLTHNNIRTIKYLMFTLPEIRFYLEEPPCCTPGVKKNINVHFTESKDIILFSDIITGDLYQLNVKSLTRKLPETAIKLDQKIKNKIKNLITKKKVIFKEKLKYNNNFKRDMKTKQNGDYMFDFSYNSLDNMSIEEVNNIFDLNLNNYKHLVVPETATSIDSIKKDEYDIIELPFMDSDLINTKEPIGKMDIHNEIVLNTSFIHELITGKLHEIAIDILEQSGLSETDYRTANESENRAFRKFVDDNISFMFNKSYEELINPNFDNYNIGIWQRYATKDEIDNYHSLLSKKLKKTMRGTLNKKYKSYVPVKPIPYSVHEAQVNIDKARRRKKAEEKQRLAAYSAASEEPGWTTVSRRR
ncbi:DEAD/DEAH box helicase family protein [bacterium]|nr:DEAD/DEAH box helicase family protein [bacterium]